MNVPSIRMMIYVAVILGVASSLPPYGLTHRNAAWTVMSLMMGLGMLVTIGVVGLRVAEGYAHWPRWFLVVPIGVTVASLCYLLGEVQLAFAVEGWDPCLDYRFLVVKALSVLSVFALMDWMRGFRKCEEHPTDE